MSYTGIVLSFQLSWLRALVNRSVSLVAFKISVTQGGKFSKFSALQKAASNCAWLSENKLLVPAFPGGFAGEIGSDSPELECSGASSTFDTFFSLYSFVTES